MVFAKRHVSSIVLVVPIILLFQTLSACKADDLSRPRSTTRAGGLQSGATTNNKNIDTANGAAVPAASETNSGDASGGAGGGDGGVTESTDGAGGTGSGTETGEGDVGTIDATGGTGGKTGDLELKSASGLSFLMNAPADVHTSGKAYGVLVLLHGSTASNYKNFVKMMAGVAQENDLIRVSVLAPNGQGWNEGGEVAAADALHALVQQEIMAKYNIDKKKVLFSGQSSGGGFLSTNFIPQHAKDYQGGAFLQCGAAAPRVAFTPDAATKSSFKLHFEITTGDTIWPSSYANALNKYSAAGMQFSKDDTKPGGHCAFDQQQVIRDHIGYVLGATAAP